MTTYTNLGTENISGQNQSGANANRPVHILTATSIIGDKVINRAGEDIGEINNIMVNMLDGTIQYLVIEFGGFLGVGEKLFAIPSSALKLNAKDQNFTLDVEKSFLESAPGFDKEHWPETNSHYFDVNAHWGSFMGAHTGA